MTAQAQSVLVVEDESSIASFVALYLKNAGYAVRTAATGTEALAQVDSERPDLIVLDLMLPDVDGIEVCRRIRKDSDVPILMLTARDEDVDKIIGLEVGADDYLTKPFNPRELVARIRAVLRRAQGRVVEGSLQVGPVVLDRDLRRVTVEGEAVKLTFSEFELLGCLMSRPGYAFNRQELLRSIWGDSAYRDPRAIDVHIRHLREKLEPRPEEPSLILTVPGTGYRFRES